MTRLLELPRLSGLPPKMHEQSTAVIYENCSFRAKYSLRAAAVRDVLTKWLDAHTGCIIGYRPAAFAAKSRVPADTNTSRSHDQLAAKGCVWQKGSKRWTKVKMGEAVRSGRSANPFPVLLSLRRANRVSLAPVFQTNNG